MNKIASVTIGIYVTVFILFSGSVSWCGWLFGGYDSYEIDLGYGNEINARIEESLLDRIKFLELAVLYDRESIKHMKTYAKQGNESFIKLAQITGFGGVRFVVKKDDDDSVNMVVKYVSDKDVTIDRTSISVEGREDEKVEVTSYHNNINFSYIRIELDK